MGSPKSPEVSPGDYRRERETASDLERTTGFEPATPTLARWCSTTEPRPQTAPSS